VRTTEHGAGHSAHADHSVEPRFLRIK